MNKSYWFDLWGAVDYGDAYDDPVLAIKVTEHDLLDDRLSPGARLCLLWLRFTACHGDLSESTRASLAVDLDVDSQAISKWLKELTEAGLLEDFGGQWTDRSDNGFVYFVQAISGGPIKIGTSVDPERRLAQLQTSSPEKLVILATVKGGIALEQDLHKRFLGSLIHLEWFYPDEEILMLVDSLR